MLGLRVPGLVVLKLNPYSNIQTEGFEVEFLPGMLAYGSILQEWRTMRRKLPVGFGRTKMHWPWLHCKLQKCKLVCFAHCFLHYLRSARRSFHEFGRATKTKPVYPSERLNGAQSLARARQGLALTFFMISPPRFLHCDAYDANFVLRLSESLTMNECTIYDLHAGKLTKMHTWLEHIPPSRKVGTLIDVSIRQ